MRFFSVKVTSKGQFTLPQDVRDIMQVSPGDRLELFVDRAGVTTLRPINKPASIIFGRGKRYARQASEAEREAAIGAAVATRGAPVRQRKVK